MSKKPLPGERAWKAFCEEVYNGHGFGDFETIDADAKRAWAKAESAAAANEREDCARIADIWAATKPAGGPHAQAFAVVASDTGAKIAAAIRERSNQ